MISLEFFEKLSFFYKKKTYNLGIMKVFNFRIHVGLVKKSFTFKVVFVEFFCDTFILNQIPTQTPN